jgi:hypothetical protein
LQDTSKLKFCRFVCCLVAVLCDAGRKEAAGRLESSIACASRILRRRQVAERAVRALIVILISPLLKDDLRFQETAEEFPVQALVAQLVVKALDVAVLPRVSPA